MRSWWERHLLVYLGYFLLIVLLRLVFGGVDRVVQLSTIGFLVGGLIGMGFSLVDRFVYVYFSRPEEQLSVQVRDFMRARRYRDGLKTLMLRREEQVKLAMNNVLFLAAWIVLAVFLVTSSGSEFSVGLVIGVGLDMAYDLVTDWKRKDYLIQRLFWPVRRQVSLFELKVVSGVFLAVFGVISLMAVV